MDTMTWRLHAFNCGFIHLYTSAQNTFSKIGMALIIDIAKTNEEKSAEHLFVNQSTR